MKRAIIFFILGFGVASFYFTGGLTLNKDSLKMKDFDVDHIITGVGDVTNDLLSWIPSLLFPQEDVATLKDDLLQRIDGLDQEAAIKVIEDTLNKMSDSLSVEEQASLQEAVTQYYKDKVLKEYRSSLESQQLD